MLTFFSSASNLITGDVISQQFENFLHSDAKGLDFISFSLSEECRVDVFLHQRMGGSYPDLWTFCKNLLLLSHGQAEVERGFSTNKEVETCNLTEEGIIAQRLICDHVRVFGGVTKVPLTKEMISYCATARTRYRAYLEEERSKREKDDQKKKRKNMMEELEDLKRQQRSLEGVCESLQNDVDQMAEKAENSAGTKMAALITKSNTPRRRAKEKREQLAALTADIENRASELRCLTDWTKNCARMLVFCLFITLSVLGLHFTCLLQYDLFTYCLYVIYSSIVVELRRQLPDMHFMLVNMH